MQFSGLRFSAVGAVFLLLAGGLAAAQRAGPDVDRDEIIHVLNRVTFGPRPGDVEMVQKLGGVRAYIEQQLHPEQIDDSAVEQDLAGLDLLQKSPQELAQILQDEQKAQRLKAQERQQPATANIAPAFNGTPNNGVQPIQTSLQTTPGEANPNRMQQMQAFMKRNVSATAVGQLQQDKLIRAIESNRQLQEVLVDFWGNHFNIDVKKGPDRLLKLTDDREVIRPHILGSFHDLLEASAKSPAMLYYLDNALSSVQHTVLLGEAQMAARMRERMMENGNGVPAPEVPQVGEKRGGINENYAREIMELHTLGVDGGYTQQDVQEVARCFTGWSVERETGAFQFRPRMHDYGQKIVLGHVIPAGGGIQDGETVLNILAASPATAHHIALQMCERFVSDDPPPALVDHIAKVFLRTNGNLRAVTEAILTSPEFLSPSDFNTKIKSPLEFAVSAVRATGANIVVAQEQPGNPQRLLVSMEGAGTLGRQQAIDRANKRPRQSLNWHIYDLGEPLFACTPPTGYTEDSRRWVSPGALIERLNFALALTEQKVSDVDFQPQTLFTGTDLDKPDEVLNRAVTALLQNHVTDATKQVLQKTAVPPQGASQTVNPNKLVALIIGSPEFQRK
jgi:uncharacterized protein (DUF1800 family)